MCKIFKIVSDQVMLLKHLVRFLPGWYMTNIHKTYMHNTHLSPHNQSHHLMVIRLVVRELSCIVGLSERLRRPARVWLTDNASAHNGWRRAGHLAQLAGSTTSQGQSTVLCKKFCCTTVLILLPL